jgi:transposase
LPCHWRHGRAESGNWQLNFKAGKSAVETIGLINKAYGSASMSRANMYWWYARFRDGREDAKDDARSGRPSTARTDEKWSLFVDC